MLLVVLIFQLGGYFRCLLPSLNVKERCQIFISKYENSVNTLYGKDEKPSIIVVNLYVPLFLYPSDNEETTHLHIAKLYPLSIDGILM